MDPSVLTTRETFEAGLLIGTTLALLIQESRPRLRPVFYAMLGMAFLVSVVQVDGQQGALLQAGLLLTAACLLTYALSQIRGQKLEREPSLDPLKEATMNTWLGAAVILVAGWTVTREVAATFSYISYQSNLQGGSITDSGGVAFTGLGLLAGFTAATLIYVGVRQIRDARQLSRITAIIVIAFSAGLVGSAAVALQAAQVVPNTILAWDTSQSLPSNSPVGAALSALFGYSAQPTVLQIILITGYLALALSLYRARAVEHDTPLGISYTDPIYRAIRQGRRFRSAVPIAMLIALGLLLAVAIFNVSFGPFDNHGSLRLGSFTAPGDQNNLFVFGLWILWLPLLSIGTLIFGRLWCGNICPLRVLTEWSRSVAVKLGFGRGAVATRNLRLAWLLPCAFILVTFVVKGLPVETQASVGALFFVMVFLAAAAVGFVFRSGTWCRYLCPIGGWLSRIARLSPLALRPDASACASCVAKPCVTGTSVAAGCPIALNPSRLETNQHCLSCWNCIVNCPPERSSLKLQWRSPGAELLGPTRPNVWEALFVASLVGMYMAVGQQSTMLTHMPWPVRFFGVLGFTTLLYLVACIPIALLAGIPWRRAVATFGYILLPLEFGTAIIAMGDDALRFLNIVQPAAIFLLGLGFTWSVVLAVSIIRNHTKTPIRALAVGIPIGLMLVSVLFIWLQWYGAPHVGPVPPVPIDLT